MNIASRGSQWRRELNVCLPRSRLKSVRAYSWVRCHLVVNISLLVILRKVSRRTFCKALRLRFAESAESASSNIVLHSRFSWLNGSLIRAETEKYYIVRFLRWPLSLWPREQALGSQIKRPFPSSPGPLFQNEGRCSAFDMEIIFHSHANKTHFHKKGCAPSLNLIVRVFGTRKWPIRGE